jgi:penicillin-binding protein 1A
MTVLISKKQQREIILWSIILFPVIFSFILFYNIWIGNLGFMPKLEELENPKSNLATEIYSEDGILIGTYFKENRSRGTYAELSPYLVNALIATEDKRFYRHSGIDFPGLVRVLFKTVLSGNRSSGGGSTITQQLAKMLFPREEFSNPLQMVNRKFREWVIAVKLERSYTKEEIIALYFNQLDFLNLAVGIKSASKVYFNCAPLELKIEHAAMLVGMAKNPSFYNPVRRPEATLHRRNVVLSQMLKVDYITRQQFDSLKTLPLGLDFQKVDHKLGMATYFREFLRMEMNAKEPVRKNYWDEKKYIEDSIEWATNPLYGWCYKNLKPDGSTYNIYKDGLRIYTTVNSKMQVYAEQAVDEHLKHDLQKAFDKEKVWQKNAPFSSDLTSEQLKSILTISMKRSERYRVLRNKGVSMDSIVEIFNKPTEMTVFTWRGETDTVMSPMDSIKYYKHFLQAGFMAMDPHTGYVKAYVGGIDYRHFQYDHVTQAKRQIGSTFKPFLYTLAMRDGFSPCDRVLNVPVTITDPATGVVWTPKSGSRDEWLGLEVTLRFGLAQSLNNISAWLMNRFKPKAVIEIARNMGVRSEIPEVPSIALGVADLTLFEMVGAYSCYANKGVYSQPIFVTRIEDKNGNLLSTFQSNKHEAISDRTSYLMLTLLERVVQRGTSTRIHSENFPYKIKAEVAGKTGTTNNQSDGWFIGITPNLVAGAWSGGEDRSIHFNSLTLGQGANMALPIWAIFMRKVYDNGTLGIKETDTFEKPADFFDTFNCIDYDGQDGSNSQEYNEIESDEFY